jgi:hypothetical protein
VSSLLTSPTLDSIRKKISAEFERSHILHNRLRPAPNVDMRAELSLSDKAAPILQRITITPAEHQRRDCVSYEIVVPQVDDVDALFAEVLASLGFGPEVAR